MSKSKASVAESTKKNLGVGNSTAKSIAPKSLVGKGGARLAAKVSVSKVTSSKVAVAKVGAAKVTVQTLSKSVTVSKTVAKAVTPKVEFPEIPVKKAPMVSFKAGDKVVYPAHGVGLIESIQVKKIGGDDHTFYMISILETGMKIMIPLKQVETVGLRRVVDSKTIEKVYEILRDRNVTVDTQTWNRRYREYTQKLKTGSLFEIAKVIRDLSVLKSDKDLSFGERKMLDTAQGLLVKEISIAKSRPEDKVKAEIQQLFQAA